MTSKREKIYQSKWCKPKNLYNNYICEREKLYSFYERKKKSKQVFQIVEVINFFQT